MADGSSVEVVVIGGSIGAVAAIEELHHHRHIHVTVISPKQYFEYIPAALRCMVEPKHVRAATTPLNRVLRDAKRQTLVQDRAASVKNGKVVLQSGRHIKFDYCIIATGTTYEAPIHHTMRDKRGTIDERHVELQTWLERLHRSDDILIIGGGITGVELAAEIRMKFSSKSLTLATNGERLMATMESRVGRYAERYLKRRKIRVLTSTKAVSNGSDAGQYSLQDRQGKVFDVVRPQLVVNCVGGRPNSSLLDTRHIDQAGRIIVDEALRVTSLSDKVYAIGDICNRSTSHAFYAEFMGSLAARNIVCQESSKGLKSYPNAAYGVAHEPEVTVVSLGKLDGVLIFGPIVVPGLLAAAAKALLEFSYMQHVSHGGFFWLWVPMASTAMLIYRMVARLTRFTK